MLLGTTNVVLTISTCRLVNYKGLSALTLINAFTISVAQFGTAVTGLIDKISRCNIFIQFSREVSLKNFEKVKEIFLLLVLD